MGIIKSQSIQNSLINSIGIILGFISTIFLYPNILTQDQYGLTRVLLSISFVCLQFTHLGMRNTIIRFFPFFEDKTNLNNGLLFFSMLVTTIGVILFIILFFLFEDLLIKQYSSSSTLFEIYHTSLIPIVIGLVYFEVFNSYARALKSSVPGAVISDILLRVALILFLILHQYELINFKQFLFLFVTSYVGQALALVIYLISISQFNLRPNFTYLDRNKLSQIGSFSAYGILGGMTIVIVNNIDIVMLGSLSGLADTAIYSIAFYMASVITIPQKSIGKIAPTIVSTLLKQKDLSEIQKIYRSSSVTQFVTGVFIYLVIVSNLENFTRILPDKYAGIEWVVIIVGLSKVIDLFAGINGIILINSQYYRFNLIATLFLVIVSIILNLILIPLYGIIGAAIATAISIFLYNLFKGGFLYLKFKLYPFQSQSLLAIPLAIVLFGLSSFIAPFSNVYVDLLLRSFLISTIYGVLIYLLNVSDEINQVLNSVLTRFLARFNSKK